MVVVTWSDGSLHFGQIEMSESSESKGFVIEVCADISILHVCMGHAHM